MVDKVGAGDTMLSIISLLIKLKSQHLLSLFLGSLAGAISVEGLSNKVPLNKIQHAFELFSKRLDGALKVCLQFPVNN